MWLKFRDNVQRLSLRADLLAEKVHLLWYFRRRIIRILRATEIIVAVVAVMDPSDAKDIRTLDPSLWWAVCDLYREAGIKDWPDFTQLRERGIELADRD